jgi:predicted nuclease of restriction endonuclease-like (RecB) superfamily
MQYIKDIKQILAQARQKTYTAINAAMVEAYWKIGEKIVIEEQQGKERANYGEEVLKTLSINLTTEFGKGFSYANLYNMRQFHLTYPNYEIFYTLCRNLTWSHNRLIMRVQNTEAQKYYLQEAAKQQWSVRTLERNINTHTYQRIIANKEITKLNTETIDDININEFIKDPYVFEFLNIEESKNATELQIETALINNLQKFLLELDKGFSFVARQCRISTETSHFYIDLVFYNYLLKCFVVFDLKTTKLQHQDVGQLDMYVRMFDDLKKQKDDNPTIGILLCADKDETIVKYSVLSDNKQLFATKYLPYLPTEKELIDEIEREKIIFNLNQQNNEKR